MGTLRPRYPYRATTRRPGTALRRGFVVQRRAGIEHVRSVVYAVGDAGAYKSRPLRSVASGQRCPLVAPTGPDSHQSRRNRRDRPDRWKPPGRPHRADRAASGGGRQAASHARGRRFETRRAHSPEAPYPRGFRRSRGRPLVPAPRRHRAHWCPMAAFDECFQSLGGRRGQLVRRFSAVRPTSRCWARGPRHAARDNVPRPGAVRTVRLPPTAPSRSSMFWRPAPLTRSASNPAPSSSTWNRNWSPSWNSVTEMRRFGPPCLVAFWIASRQE